MAVMTSKVETEKANYRILLEFFKVEEVVSKLNQIYVGSIFQEYGIQFQVMKVHVTMTTKVGCKQIVFDRCSLQSWSARKENALRWENSLAG